MSRQAIDIDSLRQGHMAVVNVYKHHVKPHVGAGGRGRLIWEPINPETRAGMRRLFHGFVLKDLAAYTGYPVEALKRWLTDQFCPPQFDEAGNELQKSTERMSDEEYTQFLLEVQAFCVLDVGLEFTEQES